MDMLVPKRLILQYTEKDIFETKSLWDEETQRYFVMWINNLDVSGKNALFYALTPKHPQLTPSLSRLKLLLKLGVSPNVQDEDGNTALHYWFLTCIFVPPKFIKCLCENIDLSITNNKNQTALDVSRTSDLPDHYYWEGIRKLKYYTSIEYRNIVEKYFSAKPKKKRKKRVRKKITFDHPKIKNAYKEDRCLICHTEFNENLEKEIFEPKCGHLFHLECIQSWKKTHKVCPLCGRSFK